MRILLVSQYFWPEPFLINDLVKELVARGNLVDVFTGKPNYPDGEVYEGYSARGFVIDDEFDKRVTVYRAPLRPRYAGGAKNLVLNYISFVLNGLLYSGRIIDKDRKYDVVFVFAPSPITSALPAIYLKWRFQSHLAIWIQDLWPESLKATGFVENRGLLGLVGLFVRGIYFCADTLLIQSEAFRAAVTKYSRKEKVVYYPNSCEKNSFSVDRKTEIRESLIQEIEDNFCLIFSGNLGTAQSVETLVKLADRLRHLPNFKLVLVGSGCMLDWIKKQKELNRLDNLLIAGRYPRAEMSQFYSRADALLVTLKRSEIFSYTVPSKVQAYLAAGRPIVAAIDGEGARIIEEAGAGFTCGAEDYVALSECVEKMYYMSAVEREQLGNSGYQYFLEHFEMGRQSEVLVSILADRISKAGEGVE